jgi:cytochrome c biogenesis protein CcmG/thiol:disulfide interchange protein DsbE
MKEKIIIAVIVLTVVSLFIFTGCCSLTDSGRSSGDFTLKDVNGNEVSLSEYRGEVVVLNFWATWCPPCREEIPDFIEVYDNYKDRGVQFLGVSSEDVNTLKDFISNYGINYTVLVDNEGVGDDWGIDAIPTTFIIDREGQVVFKTVGMMTRDQLENAIEDAI